MSFRGGSLAAASSILQCPLVRPSVWEKQKESEIIRCVFKSGVHLTQLCKSAVCIHKLFKSALYISYVTQLLMCKKTLISCCEKWRLVMLLGYLPGQLSHYLSLADYWCSRLAPVRCWKTASGRPGQGCSPAGKTGERCCRSRPGLVAGGWRSSLTIHKHRLTRATQATG